MVHSSKIGDHHPPRGPRGHSVTRLKSVSENTTFAVSRVSTVYLLNVTNLGAPVIRYSWPTPGMR